MQNKWLHLLASVTIGMTLVGCGSGGENGSSEPAPIQSATLNDSQIAGVDYNCSGVTQGTTDENGTFRYSTDCSVVNFSIGSVSLGAIRTNNIGNASAIYLGDLLGLDRNDTSNPTLVKMLQLVQSLDSDNNPNNGISIDTQTKEALSHVSSIQLDNNTTTENDLENIIVDSNKTLINQSYAIAHYEDTLRKDLNISVDSVAPAPAIVVSPRLVTNADSFHLLINGEIGAKVFINDEDTGISIDTQHNAEILVDTTGEDGEYSYNITLEDAAHRMSDAVVVHIVKDTQGPVFISDANLSIVENQTSLREVHANDPHGVSFSLEGGDSSALQLNATTGMLSFIQAPDYETKTDYTTNLVATDSLGNRSILPLNISVENINDNAPQLLTTNFNVDENIQVVSTLQSHDADDLNESFIYTLSGSDAMAFDINESTSLLTFKVLPDFETKSNYEINVTVSDGEFNTTSPVHININNINDIAPVITTTDTNVSENQTMAVSLAAVDNDHLDEHLTYTLNGVDADLFDINETSGIVTFKNAPDYETRTEYDLNITVSDGTLTSTKTLHIYIENIDDVIPSFQTDSNITVNENSTHFTIDAEDDFPLTYSLAPSEDSSLFEIDAETGSVQFKTAPDYENPLDSNGDNKYQVAVRISDTIAEHTQEKVFTVSVLNMDDVPSPAAMQNNTLSGIVTNGTPVADAKIYLQAKDQTLRTTVSDSDGRFSFNIENLTPPFMLFATMGGSERLYSYNNGEYANTNITPVTSLILSYVAQDVNKTLDDLFIDFTNVDSGDFTSYFTTAYTNVNNLLAPSLSEALLTNFNHFYNSFDYTGFNYDRVLENYDISLSYSNIVLRLDNDTVLTTIPDINTSLDINTTGIVLNENGDAIDNALVDAYYYVDGIRYDINTTTDENGQYTITLPAYRVYNIDILSDFLNTTYTDLNTFYSNLSVLQLDNVNLVSSDVNSTLGGYIFNGRTNDKIDGATLFVRKGYNNHIGEVIATQHTDENGNYTFASLPNGSYTIEISKDGYFSSYVNRVILADNDNVNFSILADTRTSILDRGAFATVVLTWGENPSDLDSHLYIATSADNSTREHVYYSDEVAGSATPEDINDPCATEGVVASLDLDDTSSYGPETMSICEGYSQPIHYYVDNYSENYYEDVSAYAKVVVRKADGTIYEIVPPSSNPNNYNAWKVFDIDSNGNIIIVNEYTDGISDN